MNVDEQERFKLRYAKLQRALKLQGMAKATTDAYTRAVRRTAEFFDCCPDNLTAEELKEYFAALLETHSWSTIKLDRCGLQFFYRHVLNKQWDWVDIVRPPDNQPLPDILTREETHRLLATFRELRYRVYFTLIYSTGLRLNEGLRLEARDIDSAHLRLHIRNGKGNKDRFVPITVPLLRMLRQWWRAHRNPTLIFPGGGRGTVAKEKMGAATKPMCASGTQEAIRKVVAECGIKRCVSAHTMRHYLPFLTISCSAPLP